MAQENNLKITREQKERMRAYKHYFVAYTPIIIQPCNKDDVFKDWNGTGTFFQDDNHLFIITVKHVAEHFDKEFMSFKEPYSQQFNSPLKIKIKNIIIHPKQDVALLEVDKDALTLLGMEAIKLDNIDSSVWLPDKERYAFVGWPESFREQQKNGFGFICALDATLITSQCRIKKKCQAISLETPLNKDYDIFFEMQDKGIEKETGEIVRNSELNKQIKTLNGISGGGLWRLPPVQKNQLWTPTQAKLIGIQCSTLSGEKPDAQWIRGVKIRAMLELL